MIARNDGWPSIAASTAAALICTGPSGSSSVPPYPPSPGSRTSEPPPGSPLPPPNGDDMRGGDLADLKRSYRDGGR